MVKSLRRTARSGPRLLALLTLAITLPSAAWASSGVSGSARAAQGDTLTVAASYGAPNLTPPITGGDSPTVWTSQLGYEPLIRYVNDGTFRPALATSWKWVGTKKFDITLRQGVKFQDGTPVTADDVVASLKFNFAYPGFAKPWGAGVSTITKTGSDSVSIGCKSACPPLPFVLSQNVGLGWIISKEGLANKKKLESQQFGAGPYILNADETVTNDHFTWDANPNYWNPSAIHWKRIVFRVIPDNNARIAALKAGQVDLIAHVPASEAASAQSAGKLLTALCCFQGILINDRSGRLSPALKDVRVRQALNYAIDRKAIAKALGYGHATPTEQVTGAGSGVYDPKLDSTYPYNPAKAKQLLAAAGYSKGLTLKAETLGGGPGNGLDKWVLAAISYWQKVGIKVDLTTDQTVQGWLNNVAAKKFPIVGFGYGTLPIQLQAGSFYEPKSGGPHNAYVVEPKLTSLLAQARNAPTVAKSMQLYKALNSWVTHQAIAVPLAQVDTIYAYNDKKITIPALSPRNFTPILIWVAPK